MAEPGYVGSLQVDQDLEHERREWRIERIAWVVFALILLAALAGAFGDGPLARGQAGVVDTALWVDFERLERARDQSHLEIYMRLEAEDGLARLSLNRAYVEAINIRSIRPQPQSEVLAGDRVIYIFEVEATDQPLQVTIDYEAATIGSVDAHLALEGGPSLTFSQFIYP
jgi:hypothetical protein